MWRGEMHPRANTKQIIIPQSHAFFRIVKKPLEPSNLFLFSLPRRLSVFVQTIFPPDWLSPLVIWLVNRFRFLPSGKCFVERFTEPWLGSVIRPWVLRRGCPSHRNRIGTKFFHLFEQCSSGRAPILLLEVSPLSSSLDGEFWLLNRH